MYIYGNIYIYILYLLICPHNCLFNGLCCAQAQGPQRMLLACSLATVWDFHFGQISHEPWAPQANFFAMSSCLCCPLAYPFALLGPLHETYLLLAERRILCWGRWPVTAAIASTKREQQSICPLQTISGKCSGEAFF